MNVTKCSKNEDTPDQTCYSTLLLIINAISFIEFLVFFMMLIIVGMFFFNFNFSRKDNLSRSPNIMHFVFKLYQVFMIGLDIFYISSKKEEDRDFGTIVILHTVFAFIFCIDYYLRLPYYKDIVSESYCICVHSYFWASLVFLICQFTKVPTLTDNVLTMLLVGLCFFLYVIKQFRQHFFKN